MMDLDHLAVVGETLDQAVAHVEDSLGVSMGPGGQHARYGTHNRLIGLADGLYLEAIAVEPGVVPQERPRWFDLDHFKGPARLATWIVRSQDLTEDLPMLPAPMQRVVAMTRGDLRWDMTVPARGALPFDSLFPSVLQWRSPPPGDRFAPSGCALGRLVLSHPDPAPLQTALGGLIADERLVIEAGAVGLRAEIDTPNGVRLL